MVCVPVVNSSHFRARRRAAPLAKTLDATAPTQATMTRCKKMQQVSQFGTGVQLFVLLAVAIPQVFGLGVYGLLIAI